MYGYSAAEIVGKPISFLFRQSGRNEVPEIMAKLKRGEMLNISKRFAYNKDGRPIDVSLTISPIREAGWRGRRGLYDFPRYYRVEAG